MSKLADNMRFLRGQRSLSQQKVADDLIITRARYAKYEEGISEPPIDLLLRISRYFHVSIDLLISIDMRRYPIEELMKLPDNRIVLPIKVDSSGNNTIEIIPHSAKAGYMTGYSDPEYIEQLQQISLPFLGNGKYRAFPIEGDSMPPYNEKSFIVGKYVEDIKTLRPNKTYIVISKDGIVYKRIQEIGGESIQLSSDNKHYSPYALKYIDILEVWEFAAGFSTSEFESEQTDLNEIKQLLYGIKNDLKK